MRMTPVLALAVLAPALAFAVEYECKVEKKFDAERVYTPAQLEAGQFSVRIEEVGGAAALSRCSFVASKQKVTCDRYEVDKVVFDDVPKVKKYYVFRSQFDVQLFSGLAFVENNGRGGIAFGRCRLVVP